MQKHKVKKGREHHTLDPRTTDTDAKGETVSSFPTMTPPSSQAKSSRGYHYGYMMSAIVRIHSLSDCVKVVLGLMVDGTTSELGPEYRLCRRSIAWLMHFSGKSERTVQRAIRKIEEANIFNLVQRGQNIDGFTTNVWKFNPDVLEEMVAPVSSSWKQTREAISTPLPPTFELTEEMVAEAEAFGVDHGTTAWIHDEFVGIAQENDRACSDWHLAFIAYVKAAWMNGAPNRKAMDGFCAGAKRARGGMPYTATFNVYKAVAEFLTEDDDITAKLDAWAYAFFKAGYTYAARNEFVRFVADLLNPQPKQRAIKKSTPPATPKARTLTYHEPPPPRFAPEPCPPQFADLTNVKLPTRRAVPQVQSPPSEPVPTPRLAVTDGHKDAPPSRVNVVAPPPRVSPVKANVVPVPRGLYAKLLANESERMTTRLLDDGADVGSQRSSVPEVGHIGARHGGAIGAAQPMQV